MNTSEISLIKVFVDGGCLGNGGSNPKCYGSFVVQVTKTDGSMVIVRERKSFNLDLCTTNNQAEYSALLEALIYLVERSQKVRAMPQVQICMDSQLVVHQVNRTWKCKDAALCELRNMAQEALDKLSATLTWVPREEIVPVLGH